MFSVQDYKSLADSPTGLPLAEIFRQATQSRGGTFALVFLLWVALGPCMIGSQLSKLAPKESFLGLELVPKQIRGEYSGHFLEMEDFHSRKCKTSDCRFSLAVFC